MKLARKSVFSDSWNKQFDIVYDITMFVHPMRSWGAGCRCHEAERVSGQPITCQEQGKRLPEVADKVLHFVGQCVVNASRPSADQKCVAGLLPDLEAKRKSAFETLGCIAKESCAHCFNQPFSLSRVETIGDLQREFEIWQNLPAGKQHRVATHLFTGWARN